MALDPNELLLALHEGMFQDPLWCGFLEKLRTRTDALYTTLIFRTADRDTAIELFAGKPPPAHILSLFTEKYMRDPFAYRHRHEGRIYSLEELIDPGDPVHRDFHAELMVPQGMTSLRSVRVTETDSFDAWLGCAGGDGMGSPASALLSALVPHLRAALRSFVAFERERFRASITSDAFGRLNFGWLTLDAQCRIVDMTPHIDQLLQRTRVLSRGAHGRLIPASRAIDRELATLVQGYAEGSEGRPRAINLGRDPWTDMLVTPLRKQPVTSGAKPVAIVYLSGDRRSQADRCEQLADLFGLLPSEARLAWAIARGLSLQEAAQELGITIETARHYSKIIFAKTGARRQAELVRNILTSVLAIA